MQFQSDQDTAKWYVLSTACRQEMKIRDDLRRLGFHCYLPLRYELRAVKGRKQRRLVPAISEMLFVRSAKTALDEYVLKTEENVSLRWSGRRGHRTLLTVADADMDNFISVTQHTEENLTYFKPGEIKLRVGDKIKVHGGVFDGVEGVLMRVPGKRSRQLVVNIPEISAVAINLEPDLIELKKRSTLQTADVEGDIKQLFTLAYEKLFAAPDRVDQEHEYNVLVAELRQTLQRIQTRKGYTATREGEMALAVYMATIALQLPPAEAARRLLAAVGALRPTSLLRLRLQFYYGLLAPDDNMLADVTARVAQWQQGHMSAQQRAVSDEVRKVFHMP